MNRRSLLTFLGLAPVAVATGAMAAAGSTPNQIRYARGLSAIDARAGIYTVTGEGAVEMITVPRTEYEFEHFGTGFLSRAYKNNITLSLPRKVGEVDPYVDEHGITCSFGLLPEEFVRYQDFVSEDDEVFASVDGDVIKVVNRTKQREAYAMREMLHIT